jgi:hypothetical protein
VRIGWHWIRSEIAKAADHRKQEAVGTEALRGFVHLLFGFAFDGRHEFGRAAQVPDGPARCLRF